ncbi:aldo/keto reductase [Gemmatimonadota bacterium]
MDIHNDSIIELNNGTPIPRVGLGMYQIPDGSAAMHAVSYALEVGYRHIDTAMMYGNETSVGKAVRESGLPREEIFITTKLWNDDHGYDEAINAFHQSLKSLDLGYVDLYLIHWPVEEKRGDSWRALETLYEEGLCRAIGVSNYMTWHLDELMASCRVKPAVNQVEFSPFLYLRDLLERCRRDEIVLEAYSPLTKGKRLGDERLMAIAAELGRSPAQVLIRWALQHDLVVIPKSVRPEHILANNDVFDFSIPSAQMEQLDDMNEDLRTSWDPSKQK